MRGSGDAVNGDVVNGDVGRAGNHLKRTLKCRRWPHAADKMKAPEAAGKANPASAGASSSAASTSATSQPGKSSKADEGAFSDCESGGRTQLAVNSSACGAPAAFPPA